MLMPTLGGYAYVEVQRKIIVDEDTAHGADGNGNGNPGGKWSGRRQKGDPAKQRSKPTKEPSMKKREAKVEEMTKEDRIEDSMFIPTDEQGWLTMLLVRAQHDEEVSLRTFVVSNSTPPPPGRGFFSPTPAPIKPLDPPPTRYRPPPHPATCGTSSEHVEYRCHDCHSGTGFASRPRRPRGTHLSDSAWSTGYLLAPEHAPLHMIFSLHPSCSPHRPPPPLGGLVQLCPATPLSTTTLQRMPGSWRWRYAYRRIYV